MQDAEIQGGTPIVLAHGVRRRGFVIGASAFGLSGVALFTAACSQPSAPRPPRPAPGKADAPAAARPPSRRRRQHRPPPAPATSASRRLPAKARHPRVVSMVVGGEAAV